MNKLAHIANTLASNTLSARSMSHVKGGIDIQVTALVPNVTNIVADEKRRERPGGGINTN